MKPVRKHIICILFIFIACTSPASQAHSQVIEIVKEAIIKVIKQIDLKVQRLQNATIELQNVQKQIENTLSKLKLNEISDWTNKQKQLYQDYFDELWRVKSVISYYRRVHRMIDQQKQLMQEYKKAYDLVRQDNNFSAGELAYIYRVYSGIIDQSIGTLDQLLVIVQSFSLQMSDADRLALINQCSDQMEGYLADLRTFTNNNTTLSLQRAKEKGDINAIRKLYGLN